MSTQPRTLLCSYRYDPLDRLADCTPTAQASNQRFYLNDRLSTEIQGTLQHSVMQYENHLLAHQQRQAGTRHTHLLATDQQRSVLALIDSTRAHLLAYSPYGHRAPENGLLSLLAFNGEQPDPITGCYLLGNGYRAFNPVLMRFNSPDSWSPFGRGGLNAYGYCVGDPVNRSDPTGHFGNPWKGLMNFLKLRTPRMARSTSAPTLQQPTEAPPAYSYSNHTDNPQIQTSPPTASTTNEPHPSPAMNSSRATARQPPGYEGRWSPPSNRPPSYRDDQLYELSEQKLNTQYQKLETETNPNKMELQLNRVDYIVRLQKNLMRTDSKRTIRIEHNEILQKLRKLP